MTPSGDRPETPPVPVESPRSRGGGFGRRRWMWLTGAIVVVLLGGALFAATRDSSPPPLDRAQVGTIASDVVKKAIESAQSAPAPSAVAYQQILPSLVEIETERADSSGDAAGGLGAGVIINATGSIMTALHVVEGATGIRVSFVDGTKASATVASTDPKNDIAVLQPEHGPETIVPAVLGGGGQVGDMTYAVGHPLGYTGSLSAGVISGLNRTVTVKGGKKLTGLIQFDAAVNPGNSGGPLLNRSGQVIGIVTALANPAAARDGYFIGIGFAVPIGTAGGAGNVPQK